MCTKTSTRKVVLAAVQLPSTAVSKTTRHDKDAVTPTCQEASVKGARPAIAAQRRQVAWTVFNWTLYIAVRPCPVAPAKVQLEEAEPLWCHWSQKTGQWLAKARSVSANSFKQLPLLKTFIFIVKYSVSSSIFHLMTRFLPTSACKCLRIWLGTSPHQLSPPKIGWCNLHQCVRLGPKNTGGEDWKRRKKITKEADTIGHLNETVLKSSQWNGWANGAMHVHIFWRFCSVPCIPCVPAFPGVSWVPLVLFGWFVVLPCI